MFELGYTHVDNEEDDSNSDYGIGSLWPCSSPGSQSWFSYAWSEIVVDNPINFDPSISIPPSVSWDSEFSIPPDSFLPEFRADRLVLGSQAPGVLSITTGCPNLVSFSAEIGCINGYPTHERTCASRISMFVHLPISLEVELAFSLRNLMMNSPIQYVLSQVGSSRKTNISDHPLVACECYNKLFLAHALDCRENNLQPMRSSIYCGIFRPFRVDSLVYIFYLFEDLHEGFAVIGSNFDFMKSLCFSNFKFSYHQEHSLPGHAQENHFHWTLRLSLLISSESSPLGILEIVYYPQKSSFPSKDQGVPGPKRKQSRSSRKRDYTVVWGSSNGRKMLLDPLQTFEHNANARLESREVSACSQTNNQHTRKESTTTWNACELISLQELEQHYGKKRIEAAESLQVSVSTFKRICRKRGIQRWPSARRKRDKCFLSAQKCNTSVQVVDGHVSAPQAFPSALQSLSSFCPVIESNQEFPLCFTQSNHREGNRSFNRNTPGYSETSRGNYAPGEEGRDTSSMSSQKRKRLEKERDCMNEVAHFEEQPSEILSSIPKRQAVNNASKDSSCLSSISETIEGNNKGYNPNAKLMITGCIVDDLNPTHVGAHQSLESISAQPLNSLSCGGNTAQNTKLHFVNLIASPLKDLSNPENESSMIKALSILENNLSLFSEEQAEQILGLVFDFPRLLGSWREYSQSQMCSQKSIIEMEKVQHLVETSVNDEETLKVRYEELESKEKELMEQMAALQKEKAVIAELRHEKCKKTKFLVSLAEEKAAGRTREKHMIQISTTKLKNLVDQWATIQSFFI